jgi:hypothetical protein
MGFLFPADVSVLRALSPVFPIPSSPTVKARIVSPGAEVTEGALVVVGLLVTPVGMPVGAEVSVGVTVGATQVPFEQTLGAMQLGAAPVHVLGATSGMQVPPLVWVVNLHCCVPDPEHVFVGAVQTVQSTGPELQIGVTGVVVVVGVEVDVGGIVTLAPAGISEIALIVQLAAQAEPPEVKFHLISKLVDPGLLLPPAVPVQLPVAVLGPWVATYL